MLPLHNPRSLRLMKTILQTIRRSMLGFHYTFFSAYLKVTKNSYPFFLEQYTGQGNVAMRSTGSVGKEAEEAKPAQPLPMAEEAAKTEAAGKLGFRV